MHPEVLRSLASQRTRDLREEAANRTADRGARRSLKVQAPSTTVPAADLSRSAEQLIHPRCESPSLRVATAPEPTSIGIPATAPATVLTRHDQMERNAS